MVYVLNVIKKSGIPHKIKYVIQRDKKTYTIIVTTIWNKNETFKNFTDKGPLHKS